MKTISEWTIAIRPTNGARPRKITRITGLGGDGFSVAMPCHRARAGYLFSHPVIPGAGRARFVAWQSSVPFVRDNSVTLKYHADGFAEFSAAKLGNLASRDLVSGEAKGLGLFSAPLVRPPVMGATLAMLVYGLDQFELADEQQQLVVLGPTDFYYRNCLPQNANSWTLAIYVFPRNSAPPIRIEGNRLTLAIALEPLNPPMSSVLELRTVFLAEERITIGLCVHRSIQKLQSASGWVFNGPGEYTTERRGHVLMGIYPQTEIPWGEADSPQQKLSTAKAK